MSYFFALIALITSFLQPTSQFKPLSVGNPNYEVEVVTTFEEQAQGLSGRDSMDLDKGMLFIFPTSEIRNFWMKEMQFSLDIIWIDEGVIIGFEKNVLHPAANNDEVMSVNSGRDADMVLELNAGQIQEKALSIGDSVTID